MKLLIILIASMLMGSKCTRPYTFYIIENDQSCSLNKKEFRAHTFEEYTPSVVEHCGYTGSKTKLVKKNRNGTFLSAVVTNAQNKCTSYTSFKIIAFHDKYLSLKEDLEQSKIDELNSLFFKKDKGITANSFVIKKGKMSKSSCISDKPE